MPRGKTKSKRTLEERRAEAFSCFAKGMSDAEVAVRIGVTRQTAYNYRQRYEDAVHERASANPRLLRDVLANTMRALEELDLLRADAWQHMEDRAIKTKHECTACGHVDKTVERIYVPDDTRVKYMGQLLKAQEMRAKLLGVLGIKQDVFVAIMQVKVVADHVLRFMGEELCAQDRAKLEEFLLTPELREYMGGGNVLDVVEVEALEGADSAA